MDHKDALQAITYVTKHSPKRSFNQAVDLIITLKDLDLKKPDQQVDFFMSMPHKRAKAAKVCGLVGPELYDQAKEALDAAISIDEFKTFAKDKRAAKKLGRTYDFFVAQADIMPKVAQTFGKILGPLAKMPNPKAGCVVPPNANLSQLYDKLQYTLHVLVKKQKMFQAGIGREDGDANAIAENAFAVYDQLMHHLPLEKNNIKDVFVKVTMGKAVKLGEPFPDISETSKKGKKAPEAQAEPTTEEKPEEAAEETATPDGDAETAEVTKE